MSESKKGGCKKCLGCTCVFILLIGGLIVGGFYYFLHAYAPYAKEGENFLKMIRAENYNAAYNMTSRDYQSGVKYPEFIQQFKKYNVSGLLPRDKIEVAVFPWTNGVHVFTGVADPETRKGVAIFMTMQEEDTLLVIKSIQFIEPQQMAQMPEPGDTTAILGEGLPGMEHKPDQNQQPEEIAPIVPEKPSFTLKQTSADMITDKGKPKIRISFDIRNFETTDEGGKPKCLVTVTIGISTLQGKALIKPVTENLPPITPVSATKATGSFRLPGHFLKSGKTYIITLGVQDRISQNTVKGSARLKVP